MARKQSAGGLMLNHDSQEVCYISQSSQDGDHYEMNNKAVGQNFNFMGAIDSNTGEAMGAPVNLIQEAFFNQSERIMSTHDEPVD